MCGDTGDPASYELIADKVRSHLAGIVRQKSVTQFPVAHHCYCNGEAGGRMVACDHCDKWFHVTCISGRVGRGDWLCRGCK